MSELTLETLKEAKRKLDESINDGANKAYFGGQSNILGDFYGFKVTESPWCVEDTPNQVHVKKPWMSEAYHKRIQKKWIKRFGTYNKPACFLMGDRLVMHPEIKSAHFLI